MSTLSAADAQAQLLETLRPMIPPGGMEPLETLLGLLVNCAETEGYLRGFRDAVEKLRELEGEA